MLNEETLQVWLLDFTEANAIVTRSLAQNQDDKFYFSSQHYALIDCNNRYFLVNKECDFILPQINDIKKPQLLFELHVMQELKDAIQLYSPLKSNLNADFIDTNLKTQYTLSLRQFMAEHFNSSPRVVGNMKELLNYMNQEQKTIKYVLA